MVERRKKKQRKQIQKFDCLENEKIFLDEQKAFYILINLKFYHLMKKRKKRRYKVLIFYLKTCWPGEIYELQP